ncbi:hypothetical protein BTVI_64380 [Pitangus sulphuratus]|nr:hypothetical protein BTVI_64380 [Pitangus sulphuratus]
MEIMEDMIEQLHLKLWKIISRLSKTKKVAGNSQYGYTKSKKCLTSDEKAGYVGKRRPDDVVYLDLDCDMLSHSIHIVKQEMRTGHVGSTTEKGKSSKTVHLPDPVFSILLFLK